MKTLLSFIVGATGKRDSCKPSWRAWGVGPACAFLAAGLVLSTPVVRAASVTAAVGPVLSSIVARSFSVAAALTSQTINFTAPGPKTFGVAPFTISATASSGLLVSFSSLTPAVCTVIGNTVTIVAAGTCTIQASQAGNANFSAATNVNRNVTVAKASQTITFNAPAPGGKTYGDPPFTVSASASSGLAISFASVTTAVCAVSGDTVTIVTGGTCTIKASQAGDTNYLAATQVSQSVTVAKANQTITFDPPGNQTSGATFTVSAMASSGLAVTLSSLTTAVCTVSGNTVTIKGVGTCTLKASQAGNTSYNAAPSVSQSFTVVKGDQIITFALADKTYGVAPFTVSASASSGLAVTFVSLTAAVCTVSASKVTIKDVGTCTIQASQAGNANYNPASVSQSFTVAKANQTITFNALAYKYFGLPPFYDSPPFAISATTSSGLAVAFSSLTTAVCRVSGNTVTLVSAGYCTIQAAQAGNAQYNPAPNVTQSFVVQQVPVFTSPPPPNGTLGLPYSFTVTATGYPPPQFQLDDPLPTGLTLDRYTGIISGTPSALGTFTGTIEALNATTSPAPSQAFSIVIGAHANQTISFGLLADRVFGTGGFGLTATASSGLLVSFVSFTPAVCTVAGSIVTLVAGGTCTIQAQQAGNATYFAAPNVYQSFTVMPASQTITFGTLADHTLGDAPFAVSATASSGLAVAFASIAPGVCTVTGNTVTLVAGGTCTVRGSQPGNGNYSAAPNVDQSLTVSRAVGVDYVYDNAGRLTVVYDVNGDAAQYVYDAAGNITQINRFAATALSIIQFNPETGPVGKTVTIYGTGFNKTQSANTVKFNGTVASVSSGIPNRLVVTVPTGATTGPISVTNGTNTAASTRNFTVGQSAASAPTSATATTLAANSRSGALAAGVSYTKTVTYTAPTSTGPGTYTPFIKADGDFVPTGAGVVTEVSETNNTASISVVLP